MSRAEQPGAPVLDVRTYRLVPGGGAEFDRLFREVALPMLHRHGIQVVVGGPSLDDADRYCLIRAFPSAARRDRQLDAFYGSDEWRDGPDDAVTALIETYQTVLIPLTPAIAQGLLAAMASDPAGR